MTEGHTERLETALDGKYRIERKLGEGGMATVYLAQDVKHERKVALKILKPELAAVIGAERFLTEIKTTANLQHPHILALFDSGEASGYLYYVMPYIEGETLRDKLDREKQLGVEESIRIAREVADALDYAHRNGVIHRDIKPGNILLHDGRPVVADFGIALAVSAAGGGRMTETGLSLGTPHYMSPEQASADRDLSARSDVYSLGCVLYEMIGGQPPHTGPSAQSILVHILTKEATSLTELRHTVPPHVAATVAKSIEKLPADRFESAKAFMDALGDEAFTYQTRPAAATTVIEPVGTASRSGLARPWLRDTRSVAALVGGVAFAALAALGWLRPAPETPPAGVGRFIVTPPETAPIGTRGIAWRDIAISPDGRFIAYVGDTPDGSAPQLSLRAFDDLQAAPLRGAEFGHGPFFSPDGEWVGFTPINNNTTLQRISVLGGSPVTLTEAPGMIHGASWGRDDIVFGTMRGALFRIATGGGEPEAITTLNTDEGDLEHVFPHIIEGRNAVVFTIVRDSGSPLSVGDLAVLDLESGEVTDLDLVGVSPRYVSTGHLVYVAADRSMRAVPFDVGSLTVTGSAVPLLEGIIVKGTGAADFDISGTGQLVYLPGSADGGGVERSVLWVDRAGEEEPIGATPMGYVYARLSPDGGRLALEDRSGEGGIWIWDFVAENQIRLALGGGDPVYPAWTPDGTRLAFSDGASQHIHWKASNNTGDAEVMAEDVGGGGSTQPEAYFFTSDGEFVVLRQQDVPETQDDLIMIPVGGDGTPVWRLATEFNERNPVLSPDGRWMAYQSDESGRYEIYVRPFPDVEGDQVLVSNNGGGDPLWSPDGAELFYLEPGSPFELISVAVEPSDEGERFGFGQREALLEWPYVTFGEGRNYDISPDGERFVVLRSGGEEGETEVPDIHVVLNWFEELRERMGN